ncbi:MAG: cytochrome C peroxidase [Bacteroidia bacterium]|nr:cytochrome C peroxidase [Bacteroidia bacterium]
MKKLSRFFAPFVVLLALTFSFKKADLSNDYLEAYQSQIQSFAVEQENFIASVKAVPNWNEDSKSITRNEILRLRKVLKGLDFWFRYLEPTTYKKINGPLPVEWETEVFEKFEKPYRREGAGYTLALLYLDEAESGKDSVLHLLQASLNATGVYLQDSMVTRLLDPGHFYFCNRLFLLNLAAIYTSGFDCPDPDAILPELHAMLLNTGNIYLAYSKAYPGLMLNEEYLSLYKQTIGFVEASLNSYDTFDHFVFIRDYVNPLYSLNQSAIRGHQLSSRSVVDYSLNKQNNSLFDKQLYTAQNIKGHFRRVQDPKALAEIEALGKLLFYDPLFSANNKRACASCHKSQSYFADENVTSHLQLSAQSFLDRNTPSLVNSMYNHLIMADGKLLDLQEQVKAVVSNSLEMGEQPENVLKKILSCKDYKKRLSTIKAYVPEDREIGFEHLASAITFYYGKFSKQSSDFDAAMNKKAEVNAEVKAGFNLFMGKAQCATCHFVPHFNGVKPPYVGSEFEVLGVPADTNYTRLSSDVGRYAVNPAPETHRAFRTGSLRNISRTAPYMHNGVFKTLEQVIDFYNDGGGAGHGLVVPNQTLSSDSLHLNAMEKKQLLAFMKALDEHIVVDAQPAELPMSKNKALNSRKVGGEF